MDPAGAANMSGIDILSRKKHRYQSRGPVPAGALSIKAVELVYAARSPIDLKVLLIVLDEISLPAMEVILQQPIHRCGVGQRIKLGMGKQICCHRIQNRKALITGIRSKIVLRVIQLNAAAALRQESGKISVAHSLGENTGSSDAALMSARTFVVYEEKEFIL